MTLSTISQIEFNVANKIKTFGQQTNTLSSKNWFGEIPE